MTVNDPTQDPLVFVGPEPLEEVAAVRSSGCRVTPVLTEAEAVVWFGRDPMALLGALPATVRWLQIPDAGVEKWLIGGFLDRDFVLTCARGVYGEQVAEHALALILACTRGIATFARARSWYPQAVAVTTLAGAQVTVIGAGGIGTSLIRMLGPLGCTTVAVTRSGRPVPGASRSISSADLEDALSSADVVVLAAPATVETKGMINERTLDLMKPTAILVNVARGDLIDSRALLAALDRGLLSAVGLDVTDPEPLPEGHSLLTHPRVLVTPHVANPPALKRASFARHVAENCRRFRTGEPLLGVIDVERGY
ncbi:MAG: D-isomer specific 2-hydroxyacid dehydrogenase family protein [Candidatus Nanopelagicales bacterium]